MEQREGRQQKKIIKGSVPEVLKKIKIKNIQFYLISKVLGSQRPYNKQIVAKKGKFKFALLAKILGERRGVGGGNSREVGNDCEGVEKGK